MPKTIRAKLLLGWMPQDEALQFLDKCVFDAPLTQTQALDIWNGYRQKVAALPKRQVAIPHFQPLNKREKIAVADFRKMPRQIQDTIHDVVKIDPRGVAIHQFFVVTERSATYTQRMHNDRQRIKYCFGLDVQNVETTQNGNVTTIKLPHWEYDLREGQAPNGQKVLNIIEWPRFMSAVNRGDRLLLWGGYHRTYSFLSQTWPDGPEEPPLVTLITSPLSDAFFAQASSRPGVRDSVIGDVPALFSDFFDPELFMEVSFRKQRREIRFDSAAKTMWHGFVDDDS
jgi:hypothetical protein